MSFFLPFFLSGGSGGFVGRLMVRRDGWGKGFLYANDEYDVV